MDNVLDKKLNILKALFDIKPVDGSGRVDVGKIARVTPVINLAPVKTNPPELPNRADEKLFFGTRDYNGVKTLGAVDYKGSSLAKLPNGNRRAGNQKPAELLEKYLNSKLNIRKELKAVGAKVERAGFDAKPRYRPIFSEKRNDYQPILSEMNRKIRSAAEVTLVGEPKRIYPFEYRPVAASSEIESWIRYAKTQSTKDPEPLPLASYGAGKAPRINLLTKMLRGRQTNLKFQIPKLTIKTLTVVAVIGFSALIFTSFGQYGISVKNEVMKESNLAVANLERANKSLRVFDFEAASNNFVEAYEEFSRAGDSLNFMGASITSLFAELPGAGKLKSAKNLVEAGKLLAEAGKSMSKAVSSLSQTGTILRLTTPNHPAETRATGQASDVKHIFGDLKKSFSISGKNLSKASALLSEVSLDALPEDKQESFSEFRLRLPELEGIVSDAAEYTSFLEDLLGSNGAQPSLLATAGTVKKYLVLFQNNSELRPTGGFTGTYAVVTFKDGRLAEFLVDDVYNLDGQLKENVIPPKPLQHITPNWGMRDANWFIDFSVSAQKVMAFFKKEAGYEVDGVITISPRIISNILKVVGPIEMPDYGYAVNYENFLSTIQAEVEYGGNREQPKRVVVDMAPRLLESIYSADPGRWLDIFNVFVSGLDKKDILMYFKNLNLESFVAEKGFAGLIEKTDEDYLMITFTNVKGSKTDRVIDNAIKLHSQFTVHNSQPVIINKLTITRQHNGGSSRYGFYNKQNPSYVRVLVPEGSELLSISGNSNPGFAPLISYSGTDFKQDDNLFKLESSFYFNSEKGVSTYRESGKTGFAFWLITDPGKRKTVELEYAVPINDTACPTDTPCLKTIYIQKQPGLEVDNFEFRVGDSYIYNGEFSKDLELKFRVDN